MQSISLFITYGSSFNVTYHLLQRLQHHFGHQDTLYHLLAVEDRWHSIEATAFAVPQQQGSHFHLLDLSAIPIPQFRYNQEFRMWKQMPSQSLEKILHSTKDERLDTGIHKYTN